MKHDKVIILARPEKPTRLKGEADDEFNARLVSYVEELHRFKEQERRNEEILTEFENADA